MSHKTFSVDTTATDSSTISLLFDTTLFSGFQLASVVLSLSSTTDLEFSGSLVGGNS